MQLGIFGFLLIDTRSMLALVEVLKALDVCTKPISWWRKDGRERWWRRPYHPVRNLIQTTHFPLLHISNIRIWVKGEIYWRKLEKGEKSSFPHTWTYMYKTFIIISTAHIHEHIYLYLCRISSSWLRSRTQNKKYVSMCVFKIETE